MIRRTAPLALALLGLALSPGVAPAEEEAPAAPGRKPWNAEEMTALSGQLATAMSELRRAFRREPGFRDPNNPHRRTWQQMEQTLRGLETSARQLHNRVKGGAGFEETQGIARKIGSLLNDADVQGRSIMSSAWLDERIKPAMELINQIAPYYGSGPLYDPETKQRIDRP